MKNKSCILSFLVGSLTSWCNKNSHAMSMSCCDMVGLLTLTLSMIVGFPQDVSQFEISPQADSHALLDVYLGQRFS